MSTIAIPSTMTVVDSHTEGEPTRVVIDGWPTPAGATMAERRDDLKKHADHVRRAVVNEPRGHDAVVGALLTPPVNPGSATGVIFFNNVGYLGMCGHGTIGVVKTLSHLGRLTSGEVRIDTPVGTVSATLEADGAVTIENVPAFSHAKDVSIDVRGVGRVTGDIAYGGNWFFLSELPAFPLELRYLDELMKVTKSIMQALKARGITGANKAEIDHVELSGPPSSANADGRNFVLCPGAQYDRSPCGTGTSAKMAILHERGLLPLEQHWRQESVTGSLFTGWLTRRAEGLIPHIRGRAFITGKTELHFDPADPFQSGLSPS
ncbi:MAG TPA: proline racemase family protein [Gemmatimonadales bacterium]|nr:proline racemase family protein [Gemmatimonadales bacterium]